jgi:hypothetical protein
MASEHIGGDVIGQEKMGLPGRLHEDMPAVGVFGFQVGDIGLYDPAPGGVIENRQAPFAKIAVEFCKYGSHQRL